MNVPEAFLEAFTRVIYVSGLLDTSCECVQISDIAVFTAVGSTPLESTLILYT
jgi:hypothetical protein